MAVSVIGQRAPRVEGADKATGQGGYSANFLLPGTVWGKALRSPHAYARIKRIDARKKDEVTEFLLSFGLTPEEAQDVIQAVGVKPVKTKPHRRQAETV